jgi:hypothetical protein
MKTILLVEATEVVSGIDDLVFYLEDFVGRGLIGFDEGLLDLIGVCIAVQLVIGTAEHFQNCVGVFAEACPLGGFLCLQGG